MTMYTPPTLLGVSASRRSFALLPFAFLLWRLGVLASWRSFTPAYVIDRSILRPPHSTRRRWYHARHSRRLDEDHAPDRISPFPTPPYARRRVRRPRRLDRLGPDA